MALASRIIYFGLTKDALHYQIGNVHLKMLPGHVLDIDRDELDAAFATFLPQHASARISRAIDAFQALWPDPDAADLRRTPSESEPPAEKERPAESRSPTRLSERDMRLDAATLKEWGFSLTEMAEFGAESINLGRELIRLRDGSVPVLPEGEFLRRISAALGWSLDHATSILNFLTLEARADFLKPAKPFRHEDVYPWRFNRGLSLLRRPFLRRERDGEAEVIWGPRHLMRALEYWRSTLLSSRYKAHTSEMRSLLSWLNNKRGTAFNRTVGQLMRNAGNTVRIEFKNEDGLAVPEELGDIDVLAFDAQRRLIRILQCKNFVAAGTPYEMKGEIEKLFVEATQAGTVPEKLLLQAEWVRIHLPHLLRIIRCDETPQDWRVEPLIVVDRELVTPYLFKSPVQVVPLNELLALISEER
jgi:hypothetical protein